MEENKNLNNEETTMENNNGATTDNSVTEEKSGGAFAIGLGILVIGAAVAGTAFLAKKCSDKIEKHNINKLRKKGYTVTEPEVDKEPIDVDAEEVEKPSKRK